MFFHRPPLESLPFDIKQIILDELESEKDLLQFALTNKHWCSLIIPSQLEYRSLRLDIDQPSLWSHLAEKAGLASRIRTVVLGPNFPHPFSEDVNPWPFQPDIYPRTWMRGAVVTADDQRQSSPQDVQTAFANMIRLNTFQWIVRPHFGAQGTELPPIHDMANARHVFEGIEKAGSMKELYIADYDWRLFYPDNSDLKKDHPFYRLQGLKNLTLQAWQWTDPSPETRHVVNFFRNSLHTLSMMELDLPFIPHEVFTLTFPNLKILFLVSVNIADTGSLADRETKAITFLAKNPSIVHLNWHCRLHEIELPKGYLPNLETVVCSNVLLAALLRRPFEDSTLTTIIDFPLTAPVLTLLSSQGHQLRSLKHISTRRFTDDLFRLGDMLPALEVIGCGGWDLSQENFIRLVSSFKALRVAYDCCVAASRPTFDKEDFVRRVLEAAPSLVCATISYDDDGSGVTGARLQLVHLQEGRWEEEGDPNTVTFHGSKCSEEEFEALRVYYPLESSDFPPVFEAGWEVP